MKTILSMCFAAVTLALSPVSSAIAQQNIIYALQQADTSFVDLSVNWIAFDCSTATASVVQKFPSPIALQSFGNGILNNIVFDAYNNRLIWLIDSFANGIHMCTFDFTSQAFVVGPQIPIKYDDQLDYDMYNNRVIIRGDRGKLLGYDLNTQVTDTLADIPEFNYTRGVDENAFNPLTGQYLMHFWDNKLQQDYDSLFLINTISKSTVRKVRMFTDITADLQVDNSSKQFYGTSSGNLYSIDTGTLARTLIRHIDSDMKAIAGNEICIYDQDLKNYVVRYDVLVNRQNEGRIAIFKSVTGMNVIDTLFPNVTQIIACNIKTDSFLLQRAGGFNSIYGVSYRWFFNNTELPNEYKQRITPKQDGLYSCEVTLATGKKMTSYPAMYNALNASGAAVKNLTIQIAPNPFHDYCQINIPCVGSTSYMLCLTNSMGQLVWKQSGTTTGTVILKPSETPPGIYYYQLETSAEIWRGKIELQ
ncbi:MAG: T9SS type A sorting domain-containing protein [Chitinophagaceae bacterium]